MLDPTPRQAEVLDYIRRYRIDHEMAPSVREIGKFLGVGSTQAQRLLDALEASGAIQRVPRIPRSIRLA